MKNIRYILFPVTVFFLLSISLISFAQEGRATFEVFPKEADVVELSKKLRESESAFKDADGDGTYDTVTLSRQKGSGNSPDVVKLTCEIDSANSYGITYLDGRNVVFYPSTISIIPEPGEFALSGFVHYIDRQTGVSLYFAVVINRLSEKDEEALRNDGKRVLPYQADFIDSNGLRVGIPMLMILPYSKLLYNAEFQKFNKSNDTILLGTNPSAKNRELYIFRKLDDSPDNLMLIHYKWY